MKAKPPEQKRISQPPAETEFGAGIKGSGKKVPPILEKTSVKLTFEEQIGLNKDLLRYAAKKRWDIVEELLRRGAKPSEKDVFLYNAATYAAEDGEMRILTLMVRKGFQFSINEGASRAAYIKAIANGHTQTVKLILRSGDFIDGMEKREFTHKEMGALLEFLRENMADA